MGRHRTALLVLGLLVLSPTTWAAEAGSPTGCPCWTFEDLSNEFLNDPHNIYCINTQFETEIISQRLTGTAHISSASVVSQLFNDPNTGRCNASFENVRLFNSSFIEDPRVIEECLNDLDQLRQSRPCQ